MGPRTNSEKQDAGLKPGATKAGRRKAKEPFGCAQDKPAGTPFALAQGKPALRKANT